MREEEELIEEARRSVEETEELREESGLGQSSDDSQPGPKTSSGDADGATDDD
jgi:hypothetical protein